MTAYNFMKEFAPKVEDGSKPHTVRANGKRRHAQAGEMLQLYTGMRSPACRLLKQVTCIGSWPCHLPVCRIAGPKTWSINGKALDEKTMEDFAVADGFDSLERMARWLLETHGEDFTGTLIAWEWRAYLPAA